MKKLILLKTTLIVVCCLLFGLKSQANDTIRLTWEAKANALKTLYLVVPVGESFTVDWGDDSMNTYWGQADSSGYYTTEVIHRYQNLNDYIVTITGKSEDCVFRSFDVTNRTVKSLDVSNAIQLEELFCNRNKLSSLDLSHNTVLINLFCDNNQLSSLDLSKNVKLEYLVCSNNMLSSLDLSQNTMLDAVRCDRNQLTSLDVSNSTALTYLKCSSNKLNLADLYAASLKIEDTNQKVFGYQYLDIQKVALNSEITITPDSVLGGIHTRFWRIFKNENAATTLETDYELNGTKIKFKTRGYYTIEMNNSAITSQYSYRARVIAAFSVGELNDDATLKSLTVSKDTLSPVFSPDNVNYTVNLPYGDSTINITAIANHAMATVTGTGYTTLSVGNNIRTITVRAEDWVTKKTYTINVVRAEKVIVNITGVKLNTANLEMEVNSVKTLVASVLPNNATNKNLIWKSSNENIATVINGMVTAKTEGSTYVVVLTEEGSYMDICQVNVTEVTLDSIPGKDSTSTGNIAVTGIQVLPHYISLNVGDTAYTSAHVLPYNATNQSIIVHNYNPDIVVISPETMIVTALSPGNALILLTTVDGGYTDTCHISVAEAPSDTTLPENIAVTGIQVTPSSISLNIGETTQVTAHVLPYNAANQTISIHNSNPDVATIDPTTKIVKALSIGSALISFVTEDGNFMSTCTINVSDTTLPENIAVTGIQVTPSSISLYVNGIAYVTTDVLPYNATNQTVAIQNSNSAVATIDPATKQVTAWSPGTTSITFTTEDGNYTATCYINVEEPFAYVSELSGIVTRKDNSPVTTGMVLLYAVESSDSYYAVDTTLLTQNGSYVFKNVKDGDYLIKAIAHNLPNAVPTYYWNKKNLTNATIISVSDSSFIKDLNIVIVELDPLNGNASISGYVGKESGSNVLSKSAMANPCQDVNVYLQAKKDDMFVTIAITQTNINGFYEFRNVPVGEYKVILDVEGLNMLNSHTINITNGDENVDGNNYIITGEGIDTEHGTGINDAQQKEKVVYHAYPNPTQGLLTIQNIEKSAGFIEIYNLEGKLMQKHKVSFTEETIDMSTLVNGVYMLRIGDKSIRIIKQ